MMKDEPRPGLGSKVTIIGTIVECPTADVVLVELPACGPIKVVAIRRSEIKAALRPAFQPSLASTSTLIAGRASAEPSDPPTEKPHGQDQGRSGATRPTADEQGTAPQASEEGSSKGKAG